MDPTNFMCFRPAGAASYLSLSPQRLAKLRLEGGGPHFVKVGRTILYRVVDLDDWLARHRRVSTSDQGGKLGWEA